MRVLSLLSLGLFAGAASAQSDTPWDGLYVGVNAGGALNKTCANSALRGLTENVTESTRLSNCASGDLLGGVQIGENFQTKRLVWGIGADVDIWSAKSDNPLVKYSGQVPPAGTYAFSGKTTPSDFLVVGTRLGYAGDLWLPYLRAGAIITTGSRDSTLSYTPPGATKPTASFNGGKAFGSTGWVAGGGTEIGLNGAWSITAEYLHVNFSKGSDTTATCTGAASTCAAFSGISFTGIRTSDSTNIFRIGINHWFGYWEP